MLLLAPVTDPAAIPHALASALNLQVVQGDVLAACVALLGERPGLLVVDNCEHLLDAARETVERAPVGVPAAVGAGHQPRTARAGRRVRLPAGAAPAARPGHGGPGRRAPVGGGVPRPGPPGPPRPPARRRPSCGWWPTSSAASTGMPLAIELAAGRLSGFSLVDLHRRLDRALDLLGGPDRRRGPAPHAARHRRVVLPAARRRRAAAVPVPVGVRRRDRARRRRAARHRPGPGGRPRHRAVPAGRRVDARRRVSPRAAPATGCWRRCGRSASTGSPPRARTATRRTACSGGRSTSTGGSARRCDRARARGGRRAAPRDGEPAGGVAAGPRPRTVDDAAAMVVALFEAIGYRDLVELRDWAEELADDPALAGTPARPPCWAPPPRRPTTAGTTRRADRLARAGLERATDGRVVVLPASRWPWPPWRAGVAEAVEHCIAAAARRDPGGRDLGRGGAGHGLRRRPRSGAGAARRGRADAVSPSMRAWSAYVAGEIESLAGNAGAAEQHYRRHRPGPRLRRDLPRRRRIRGPGRPARRAGRMPRRSTATATSSTTSPAPATGPTCGRRCATWRTCSADSATIPPAFSTPPPTSPERPPSTGVIGDSNLRPRPSSRANVLRIAGRDRAEPRSVTDPTAVPLGAGGAPPRRTLLPDPGGVAVDAEHPDQPGGLRRLRRQRPDLAVRGRRIQQDVHGKPLRRWRPDSRAGRRPGSRSGRPPRRPRLGVSPRAAAARRAEQRGRRRRRPRPRPCGWSGWPVMPSGPKVRTVSGRTSVDHRAQPLDRAVRVGRGALPSR